MNYIFLIPMIILSIILVLILMNVSIFSSFDHRSTQEIAKELFITMFLCTSMLFICYFFVPDFSKLREMISKMTSIWYPVIYTILLLILCTTISIKSYGWIVSPVLVSIGMGMFYMGFKTNSSDIVIERLKMIILLMCGITSTSVLFHYGEIDSNYAIPFLLLTVCLLVYVMLLFGVTTNINYVVSNSYVMPVILLMMLVLIIAFFLKKGDVFESVSKGASVCLLMTMIVGLLCGMYYSEISAISSLPYTNYKYSLTLLMGIIMVGVVIYWMLSIIKINNINSNLMNLLFFIGAIGIIYKVIFPNVNNIVPLKLLLNSKSLLGLFGVIIAIMFYGKAMDKWKSTFVLQNGDLLVKSPISLSEATMLKQIETVVPNYSYAMSSWIFLDVAPQKNAFKQILTFSNKPLITYNPQSHILRILIQQKELHNQKYEYDEHGYRILYESKRDLLLQKWNHIVFNYTGDSLDIFINSKLVHSSKNVVTYNNHDYIQCGETDGIIGGINNVLYFNNKLSYSNLIHLYNNTMPQI